MPEHPPEKPLQLLLVDSDEAFARRLGELCVRTGKPGLELTRVASAAEALALSRQHAFDVILLGAEAAVRHGLTAFNELHKWAPDLPIILLAGGDDDDTSLVAAREGAEDYLVKGDFNHRRFMHVVRHAIERKRVEARLRQSEEFFRLISENVTDLIAVIDRQGRRLYNNPAYEHNLGPASGLAGTDSFHEIHPEDRARIQSVFQETLSSGQGRRAEYRMVLGDGEIRYIESLGNVVCDEQGHPDKVVVVSRDITEHRQAMDRLRETLAQLQQAHADLHAAQARLIQTEKIEALSTFAAGIAHEVRNPLQTILLGIDFLRESLRGPVATDPATHQMVLADLENAARQADAVIQGLLEFTAYRQQEINEHDLSQLLEQSRKAVTAELAQRQVQVSLELEADLPLVRVDARKIRHVLIKLLLGLAERLPAGAPLIVRTCRTSKARHPSGRDPSSPAESPAAYVCIELEYSAPPPNATVEAHVPALIRKEDLDLMVVKKVVELYGGIVETQGGVPGLVRTRMLFRPDPQPKL